MPLTPKGEEIKSAMQKEYGAKKGEQVLYASKNKGTITGIDSLQSTIGRVDKNVVRNWDNMTSEYNGK